MGTRLVAFHCSKDFKSEFLGKNLHLHFQNIFIILNFSEKNQNFSEKNQNKFTSRRCQSFYQILLSVPVSHMKRKSIKKLNHISFSRLLHPRKIKHLTF